MFGWDAFREDYDVLGVESSGFVFGVENLKENRESVLKVYLCTNKAETLR